MINDDEFKLFQWTAHPLHPSDANEKAIEWIFLTNTLNFSFYATSEDDEYTISYDGVAYTGYYALCAAVNRAIHVDGIPLTSATYMSNMTADLMRKILRCDQPDKEMPMIEERAQVVREAGQVLLDVISSFNHIFTTFSELLLIILEI